MKTKFRAIIKVGNKEQAFAKLGATPQNLINMIKEEGLSVKSIVKMETVQVSEEKQKGRTKAKY